MYIHGTAKHRTCGQVVVISCHHEVMSPTGRQLRLRGVRGSTLRGRTVHLHQQCSAFPLHSLRLRSIERRRMRCGCCDCCDQPLSSCCRSSARLREAAVLLRVRPVLQRTLQVCFCHRTPLNFAFYHILRTPHSSLPVFHCPQSRGRWETPLINQVLVFSVLAWRLRLLRP